MTRRENIDALLAHLEEGTLARELVSLLRETEPDRWDPVLREHLERRVQQEVSRLRNAKDQSS